MKNSPSKEVAVRRTEDLAREWPELAISKRSEFVRNILRRVTVSHTTVWIEIERAKLLAMLLEQHPNALPSSFIRKVDVLKLTSEFLVRRQRGELRVLAPHGGSCFETAREPSLV